MKEKTVRSFLLRCVKDAQDRHKVNDLYNFGLNMGFIEMMLRDPTVTNLDDIHKFKTANNNVEGGVKQ